MMSTGQDFIPKPYPPCPPSASQIKDVFLSMAFFISTGKLPQDQTPRATCTHSVKTIPFACYKCYCAWVAEELLQHLHLYLDPPKLQPSQVTFVAV